MLPVSLENNYYKLKGCTMSTKQCRKCGRFQGVNHVCPTLKSPAAPIYSAPTVNQGKPTKIAPLPKAASERKRAQLLPNSLKIQAVISDPAKLNSITKALEFSIGTNSNEPTEAQKQMRVKLEATFGAIDWNA